LYLDFSRPVETPLATKDYPGVDFEIVENGIEGTVRLEA
jgi:hypothetical protein